ncbi:HAMP domain-containing sensor histidine kinase [Nucisporomicrobium flavum]|uniref:sensor histidine kinase n=1 Tax=Nucisporomicrobium flavum TaxID=2785915 RepID=UPI0027DC9340|nr:HAMP domain-containing sensor histidine kinase [Nucisporomicrobium flavum]
MLGFSTWAFGGVAAGTGPFLVLLYTWAALHFRRRVLIALVVPAAAGYVVPLVLTSQPPVVLSSAFILLPVAVAVALLVEAQARHLRDDRERLERIERWRAAMVGALAHDVRSPLATVQMTLEELAHDATGPQARMLEAAQRQTARIGRLASGLLDLNRIDTTGHLRLDLRPVPARAAVLDALSYVTAEIDVRVDDGRTLRVDRERFEQIVINLVGNALRYGRPPVVVTVTGDGVTDRLEVRDHGPGIPEDQRARLFTRFAAGGTDGVGLGLWIVRELARAHGGEARYESAGPGARMVVTFPALPGTPAELSDLPTESSTF